MPVTPVVPQALVNRLVAFLGQTGNTAFATQATEHANVVAALASEYTRGRGFDALGNPGASMQAVIISAAARLLANPEQTRQQVGAVSIYSSFDGWNAVEETLLDSYRRRAA